MKIYLGGIALVLAALTTIFGCNGCHDKKGTQEMDMKKVQEDLRHDNRVKQQKERARIDTFIQQKGWPMLQTGTGLRYWVYQKTNGDSIHEKDQVKLAYQVMLLDEQILYSADSLSPIVVTVGHDNIESGLHEALQLMRKGESAKFILPAHLAFGFTGDLEKIPQDATVMYDIHVLNP